MELKTGKVFAQGGESTEETLARLCNHFSMLIDEVGYYVSLLNSQNKALSERIAALEDKEVVS